jgi:dolichol-phosphate mannosyltransferase
MERSDVCVVIPTLEEAATIGDVLAGFREHGYEHCLVVDGGSSDDTVAIARDHGAQVLQQSGSGKGQAVREALEHVERPVVLIVDGDGTYRPADADLLVAPVLEGEHDHVIGNRFAKMSEDAMSGLNRFGNHVINRVFAIVHGRYLGDILSGYRAFDMESHERFDLQSEGFGIETELSVECMRHNLSVGVRGVHYDPRPAESATNLRPFKDGAIILLTLVRLARANNPLFYFGSIGLASSLAGVVLAVYVGWEWIVAGISHEALTVVSAFAILFGLQMVMFGALSDLMVSLHREQRRHIERLTDDEQ